MPTSEGRAVQSLLALPATRILLVAAAVAVTTGLVSIALPSTFESQASVVFSVSTQTVSSQQVSTQLLASIPSIAALVQAFTLRLGTRALSSALDEPNPSRIYQARFDERKGLLTLKARGPTAVEARKRAEKLLQIAQEHLQERLVTAARSSIISSLEQARLDLKTAEQILGDTRALLKSGPSLKTETSPTIAANLELLKIDPVISRSPNPAITYLSLQEAILATQVATARARTQALEGVLQDPESLSRMVGQALQIQVLAPPAEPVRRSSPRPALWAAIAGVGTFGVGLVLRAFFTEAARGIS